MIIKDKNNINIKQYNIFLQVKTFIKTGILILYIYKNSWQKQKTL